MIRKKDNYKMLPNQIPLHKEIGEHHLNLRVRLKLEKTGYVLPERFQTTGRWNNRRRWNIEITKKEDNYKDASTDY